MLNKDFFSHFIYMLCFQASGLPNCSQQEKENIVNDINDAMQFTGTHLELDTQLIKDCPEERYMYKTLMNSLIGKLQQKFSDTTTKIYSSIGDITDSTEDIQDVEEIDESHVEVVVKNQTKKGPCRKTNCIIGAMITSLARVDIHKHIMSLVKNNCIPYYVDVDGLIFSVPKKSKIPLPIGHSIGQFKNELGLESKIIAFFCLRKKNYSISYTKNEDKNALIKVSGLSLESFASKELLTDSEYKKMFLMSQEQDKKSLKVPQLRWTTDKMNSSYQRTVRNINFTNRFSFQRTISLKTKRLETFPYGF